MNHAALEFTLFAGCFGFVVVGIVAFVSEILSARRERKRRMAERMDPISSTRLKR